MKLKDCKVTGMELAGSVSNWTGVYNYLKYSNVINEYFIQLDEGMEAFDKDGNRIGKSKTVIEFDKAKELLKYLLDRVAANQDTKYKYNKVSEFLFNLKEWIIKVRKEHKNDTK